MNATDDGEKFTLQEFQKLATRGTAAIPEFLQEVHAWAAKPELTEEEVLLLAEFVVKEVFPLAWDRPWKETTFAWMTNVVQALVGHPELSEPAIRVLVDGWCQEMLFHAHRKTVTVAGMFFPRWEKVFFQVAQLAAHPACPLGLAGRLWRMTYLTEKQMDVSDDIVRALIVNPNVPSSFALHLHAGQTNGDVASLVSSPAFQKAQTEHADIADLPPGMFLDMMLSFPVPSEWYSELEQDFAKAEVTMTAKRINQWQVHLFPADTTWS